MGDIWKEFPYVMIEEGVGKYVLMRISYKGEDRVVLRQRIEAELHKDAARPTAYAAKHFGAEYVILGGGRINFNPEQKTIFIYGYSIDFGRANHAAAKELLQEAYPDYTITWSDEGY